MLRNLLAATAALALSAAAAQAATVTRSTTLDLSGEVFEGQYITDGFSGTFDPFALAIGDTLDITIDFLGDQEITVGEITEIYAGAFTSTDPGNSVSVTQTGVFHFLDLAGNIIYSSPSQTTTECCLAAGIVFEGFNGDLGAQPVPLTFGGVRYVGTIDGYGGGLTAKTYVHPVFEMAAREVSVSGIVPEPSAWALMILGFGTAGAMLRRAPRSRTA